MIAKCGCRPGTWDNGWHETRSEKCEEAERQVWRDMMERQKNQTVVVRRYPKSDIGPITLFVRQNGRLVRVVTVP